MGVLIRIRPFRHFYPRPPRGERRRRQQRLKEKNIFLSTPSARRATVDVFHAFCGLRISIHALREESDGIHRGHRPRKSTISIHALREESDRGHDRGKQDRQDFYPRPPRGERPALLRQVRREQAISIHALREESDRQPQERQGGRKDFYPRPPRGERPLNYQRSRAPGVFLSTPSARRATSRCLAYRPYIPISIHALREESDPCPCVGPPSV